MRGYILAGLEAGLLDGVHDDVESSLGGVNGRSEAALVAQTSGQPLVLQHCLQCVVNLGAHAKSLGEGLRTNRSDHEFWTSTPESACAPPLRMFIIGTGSTCAFGPPM